MNTSYVLIVGSSGYRGFSYYEAMPEGAGTNYPVHFWWMSARAVQFRPRAIYAETVRAGAADGRRRRARRRRDLHRQVRPREGAVPLGPRREEGREQFVLDSGVAALGRQGMGRVGPRASARK